MELQQLKSHPPVPADSVGDDDFLETLSKFGDPARFKLPIENELLQEWKHRLHAFDKGEATGLSCRIGLIFAWLAILGSFASGVFIIIIPGRDCLYPAALSTQSIQILAFVVNLVVALLTDAMGYIHSTALRWALLREGRLSSNSNTRLLNSAHSSPLNSWLANFVYMASLILCYAATSRLFVAGVEDQSLAGPLLTQPPGPGNPNQTPFVNGVAVLVLAIGLFAQAVPSTWIIMLNAREFPTWTSNPLNNTLALMHRGLPHRTGRCMMPAEFEGQKSRATIPSEKQQSLKTSSHSVVNILTLVWTLALLVFLWAVAIVLASVHSVRDEPSAWTFSPAWNIAYNHNSEDINSVHVYMTPNNSPVSKTSLVAQIICVILFTVAIQGTQTISLHCVELLVNMSRDENTWRQAQLSKRGASISSHGFVSAATSWENLTLFISKALLHWLLGQCLSITFYVDSNTKSYFVNMIYMRIFVYGIVATGLAGFATYLAFQRPRGTQPAAWGHFQTLADLIDDWGNRKGQRIWWGDKGISLGGIRHAGTSAYRDELRPIVMHELYAG
jgi:hypothetical protein